MYNLAMRLHQQSWFPKITHLSRYLGDEINSIRKDPSAVDVSIALAFPDVYEIGMSHLGLKILYHILNLQNWILAERIFAPGVDLEAQLQARRYSLSSLESGRPISEFDIIGFSLQHELCYTNILSILHLGNIPFLGKERDRWIRWLSQVALRALIPSQLHHYLMLLFWVMVRRQHFRFVKR